MRLAFFIFVAARALACIAIDRDRILAGDFPQLAAIDPKLEIAPTPIPGVARTFRPDEIAKIARARNVSLAEPGDEVCFLRATAPLTIEKLQPALLAALNLSEAEIQIVDYSRGGVPNGSVSFARSGLSPAGMWRGRLIYDQSKSVPIWVKVRVTVDRAWIEATEEIRSGALIQAGQLTIRKGRRFPFGSMPVDAIELAANQKAVRAIHSGEPIFASMLTRPPQVEVGDRVHVNVSSGGALLEFDAIAQSSARTGDTVLIKNPENNRLFQARVDAKGKVSVIK